MRDCCVFFLRSARACVFFARECVCVCECVRAWEIRVGVTCAFSQGVLRLACQGRGRVEDADEVPISPPSTPPLQPCRPSLPSSLRPPTPCLSGPCLTSPLPSPRSLAPDGGTQRELSITRNVIKKTFPSLRSRRRTRNSKPGLSHRDCRAGATTGTDKITELTRSENHTHTQTHKIGRAHV